MNIENYNWVCGKCRAKVDALKQISECFHPKTGELCFGIIKEEDAIYCVISCPKCGNKWEMNISGARNIEINQGNQLPKAALQ